MASSPLKIKSCHSEILQTKHFPSPPENIIIQINTFMNNLRNNVTLDLNINEMKPQYYPWFANHLVVEGVTQEIHGGECHLEILKNIGDANLMQCVIYVICDRIKISLDNKQKSNALSGKIKCVSLGNWLGNVTISKNIAVLEKQLNLGQSIQKTHDQDHILMTIQVIREVLTGCSRSKVFRPPNPWLINILKRIAEIYNQNQINPNIRAEIELCFINSTVAAVYPQTFRVNSQSLQMLERTNTKSRYVKTLHKIFAPLHNNAMEHIDGSLIFTSIYINPKLSTLLGSSKESVLSHKLVFKAIDWVVSKFAQKHTEKSNPNLYRERIPHLKTRVTVELTRASAPDFSAKSLYYRVQALLEQIEGLDKQSINIIARVLTNDNIEILTQTIEYMCTDNLSMHIK